MTADHRDRTARAPRRISVARAVGTFAAAGLVGLLLLAMGSVAASRRASTDEAMRDARRDSEVIGRTAVQPALQDGLLVGSPTAITALDREVRSRVLDESLVRVKVWSAGGRILYSDERRLIGSSYHLGKDEQAIWRSGGVAADVSDLSRPENRFERPLHKLLEVYLPVHTPNGTVVLFEAYFRYDSVIAGSHRIWDHFVPIMLGSLLLLELLQIPLAWSMARRLRSGEDEQERLLRNAIEASDAERRRIASDLHDGVVQDLAGVTFMLESLGGVTDPGDADVLADATASTRNSIRSLRTLLVDIYPPSLRDAGLRAALFDLTAPLTARGIACGIDLPTDVQFPPTVEALLFRACQEALRNVVEHSGARHAKITLARSDDRVVLEVEDDGCGFDPLSIADRGDRAHFGLRFLDDLAAGAGGRLEVRSQIGLRTCVHLEVPLR